MKDLVVIPQGNPITWTRSLRRSSVQRIAALGGIGFTVLLTAGACGGDGESGAAGSGGDAQRPEEVGAACEVAADCFPNVEEGDLQGEALCLDRVRDGYCTHTCEVDEDCCAAEGECRTELPQVCSPFESTGMQMCFLSCGDEEVGATDYADDSEFCQREASPDFICRSSGGGANNRKICVPGECGVGSRCAVDEDCSGDLVCLTDLLGGYCSRAGCTSDADCGGAVGEGPVCVERSDGFTYCARRCTAASDCSFCRGQGWPDGTCRDDVTFVEEGTAVSVCVPN